MNTVQLFFWSTGAFEFVSNCDFKFVSICVFEDEACPTCDTYQIEFFFSLELSEQNL